MPIYKLNRDRIEPLVQTTFSAAEIRERYDLQRLLRGSIDVIAPETLLIAEEFGDWEDTKRRIDLLAIDKQANLVVIELKRTEDGGHMELQSIRYASMVSTITFKQACEIFGRYLASQNRGTEDPRALLLDFLGWERDDEGVFADDVRIVLASADFSKEITSSVLWLIEHGIDIRCVRLKPYRLGFDRDEELLVDVQQIIPLPEAADYQFQVREKVAKERQARAGQADFTRFDIQIGDETHLSMWKRNAIFLICRRLCDQGIDPEEISSHFDWPSTRVWYVVDNHCNRDDFIRLALEKAHSGGSAFTSGRWFCDDSELVHSNGKTYAFSKQWGGEKWHQAMLILMEKYPNLKVSFSPSA